MRKQSSMNALAEVSPAAPAGVDLEPIHRLEATVSRVVHGKAEVVRLATVSMLAGGHILVEDVPGVGKTTLAQALARALGLSFQRIQFTSDLLPSDIIGVSIYRQQKGEFEFVPGPLFANVVLADEINRATPKTQSALLEAMAERRVSVERQRYVLPDPFLVLATQNPLEYLGTFPLPESQLDRFLMSLSMGYPPRADEKRLLLSGGVESLLESVPAALDRDQLLALQTAARSVTVSDKLADYMIDLAEATRAGKEFGLGVSTRGIQGLFRATQAYALCQGRDYAVPDDVQQLAIPVLAHRVTLRRGGGHLDEQRTAISRVISTVPVPV
ncbi:MAG: MoxR family ATPase [Acidobacteriota bacterium]